MKILELLRFDLEIPEYRGLTTKVTYRYYFRNKNVVLQV